MSESLDSEIIVAFGLNLRSQREWKGWSQSELARRMQGIGWPKYSQVAVSRTEEGTRAVRLDEALDLAEVLDVSFTQMITPPSDQGALVFEVQSLLRATISAAKSLHAAGEEYEDTRRSTWIALKHLTRRAPAKWASRSRQDAFERDLKQLRGLLGLSAYNVLEWTEDLEFQEDSE
ncbi:helix-turn-helix domain-containing protein [Arthrobacter woluwensis]|uniref:helix-turn-helix domain-containing protein n=1 Tax=Arthrobacter woluwensis TaxID=156980 RepID=UPI001AB01562|nr:helix-turn-helix transcriptional regulator [Arthrobacter woluwensis]QTF71263.1 helix-turn-helix transcriptional regulator [Arthrobacter woluwensis]